MAEKKLHMSMSYKDWCIPYDDAGFFAKRLIDFGNGLQWVGSVTGIYSDEVVQQGAATVQEAYDGTLECCITAKDVSVNKGDFYTWLYNGCVKFYETKGISGLQRFEDGIAHKIEEMQNGDELKDLAAIPIGFGDVEKEFPNFSLPDTFDGFQALNNPGSISTIQCLEEIAQLSMSLGKQFDTDVKKVLKPVASGEIRCCAKINLDDYQCWNSMTFLRMITKYTEKEGEKRLSYLITDSLSDLVDSESRTLKEMVQNMSKKKFRVRDLLRASVKVGNMSEMRAVKKAIATLGPIVESKDNFINHSSYPSVFLIFNYKNVLAELQIIPATLSNDKMKKLKEINHVLYEIARSGTGVFGALCQRRYKQSSWYD
jgi:hypothetical protein